MKTILVIDGNSIINRAFYGVRMLNAPDGTPTNAVYGFLAILKKLMDERSPDALCVAFDRPEPTFRHEQYDGYKAQRKGMPDELAVQMPIMKAVLDAMGVTRLELSGWEADDIIGAVAAKGEAHGYKCYIVTGDKDSFQLITDSTHVLHVKSRMGQTETIDYGPEDFAAEYGFEPKLIVDLKALMGDASDNIPGVPGVGEKTAKDLIQRFGRLNDIYKNLPELDIKDSVRSKLSAGKDKARLSYELATIRTDAPITFSPEDAKLRGEYTGELYDLFKRLGFTRFIEKWGLKPGESAKGADSPAPPSITVQTVYDTGELIGILERSEYAAVLPDSGIDAVELCVGPGCYLLERLSAGNGYAEALRFIFSDKVKKISHNVKDITANLLRQGLPADGFVFDCALAAYLLEPTENAYDIPRLAAKYGIPEANASAAAYGLYGILGDKLREISVKNHANLRECANSSPPAAATGNDAQKVHSFSLAFCDLSFAKGMDFSMERLYYDIELPLTRVLAEMENAGFTVDSAALREFGESLNSDIARLERGIFDMAGGEFNINSPKQLGAVLFEQLMLPHGKKTKTGYSTNADVLERLRGKHPIINEILEYRQLTKLKSTYADGLLKVIGSDGRIHTSFQMTITATGRLSSTEPNLQNIPVRTELGGSIRKMFTAAPGHVLVDADYSQIELRLLAHISGDETMISAFKDGADIHTVTASQVFGVEPEDVTAAQRRSAKAVNFGIVYGISDFSLAQDIGVTKGEARAYIDSYLATYHGVRGYMSDIVAKAKADGYVETLFGRRRYLPELKSPNFNVRSFGERVALNMPIQGTAADIIKIAMVRVHERLKAESPRSRLILQVHDELIAECPEAEAELTARILTEEMERAASLSVPLTAEAHSGRTWFDAK